MSKYQSVTRQTLKPDSNFVDRVNKNLTRFICFPNFRGKQILTSLTEIWCIIFVGIQFFTEKHLKECLRTLYFPWVHKKFRCEGTFFVCFFFPQTHLNRQIFRNGFSYKSRNVEKTLKSNNVSTGRRSFSSWKAKFLYALKYTIVRILISFKMFSQKQHKKIAANMIKEDAKALDNLTRIEFVQYNF